MDNWAIPGGAGAAAALSQMGWDAPAPSVPGRAPGEPFALPGSSGSGIGTQRWPLFGITPTDVNNAQYGASVAQQNYEARVAQQQAAMGGSPGTGGSGASPSSGDWSNINGLNDYISRAAAATGVDPNQIKAIMKLESDGVWQTSPAGAIGYMQVMPFWGNDLGLNLNDHYQNILAGAMVLKQNLDASGGDFHEALRRYHGYGWDGYTDDQGYANTVLQNYNTLTAYGGTGTPAQTDTWSGGSNTALQSMFGVNAVPNWGEFNVPSGNGLYGYGTQYGLNGSSHTGLDVPMAPGTAYRAPMGGVVTCGGTNNGGGADGGGCASFNCNGFCAGGSAGRVEVLLDNGAVLIYGHSSTSAYQPGQRFNAGAVLGTSGGENSGHVHLEARVRDASMPSGWRIVDPRSVLGGGAGAYGTTPASSGPQMQNGFANFWLNQYTGR